MADKPNVLFLMADELRADTLGYAGDDVVRTPTIDRLAETGQVFTNAYVPAPICVPCRQSMMAGQFPSTTGCRRFGQDLEPGSLTFARQFARHGYMTTAAGKLHHTGQDQMQGWRKRIGNESKVSQAFVEKADEAAFERYAGAEEAGTGKWWPFAEEVKKAGIGPGPDGWRDGSDEYTVWGAEEYIESYFSDVGYDRPSREQPLLLKVSLQQPHYPFFTTKERLSYYMNRVEPFVAEPSDHEFLSKWHVEVGEEVSPREVRRATAAYYGMVECVDGYFERVLDALRQVGEDLDDWIIVLTSDHGEMLGEHGVWEKQVFYEGSARVPLVIRWPDELGDGTVTENVNLCDLFATLCDLCDLPIPAGLDSRSLVGLMDGKTAEWDNETISEFCSIGMDVRNLMVKRDDLKYQYFTRSDTERLFDLDRDPTEEVDVSADPAYESTLEAFRDRRDELGWGPDADLSDRTVGYDPNPSSQARE